MNWTRSAMKTLRVFSWKSVNRTLFFKEILNLGDAVNLQEWSVLAGTSFGGGVRSAVAGGSPP